MRDIILLSGIMAVIPFLLRSPIAALLAWIWITLNNPQREVYGILGGAALNFWVAVLTVIVWLASKERKFTAPNMFTVALLTFSGWCCLTTYTALDQPAALFLLDRTMKTILLALLVTTVANTRTRIQAVLWMLAVSLGYYGVKGGAFVLATAGHSRVYGPDDSMISDNNALALMLVMLIPLLAYLRETSRLAVTRLALLGAFLLSLLAVLGTYSRGGLVALCAAGAVYAARSRYGVLLAIAAAVLFIGAPSFMPASWLERMSTLHSYSQDDSFEGRVQAWKTSYNIAVARPLVGGGFLASQNSSVVVRYASPGSLTSGRAAHSIYFQVLGDHGFAGLALYLCVVAAAWINTFVALHASRTRPELAWAGRLARMLQVSLVGFLVAGAALSMAYYDGALVILALTASLAQVVRRPAAHQAGESTLKWRQLATAPAPAAPAL